MKAHAAAHVNNNCNNNNNIGGNNALGAAIATTATAATLHRRHLSVKIKVRSYRCINSIINGVVVEQRDWRGWW